MILGICGPQGSGKSTLAAHTQRRLEQKGQTAATLSLDDLYLRSGERELLARSIHPLLRTRGVPGTHDVPLGLSILESVKAGRQTILPRFDKAVDDRSPDDAWVRVPAGLHALLFEGWCLGATPQDEDCLIEPVNDLERSEDPEGTWRRYVNSMLQGPYRKLFGYLDAFVLLAAPNFEIVARWRAEQEASLRANRPDGAKLMTDSEIDRFVQHYERLTRHILNEMPHRADLVVRLAPDRSVTAISEAKLM